MWEDKFEVFYDMTGEGKHVERLATDMDLQTALLLIKASVEEYYQETLGRYILARMPQGGESE
jgi:hypothetical protein